MFAYSALVKFAAVRLLGGVYCAPICVPEANNGRQEVGADDDGERRAKAAAARARSPADSALILAAYKAATKRKCILEKIFRLN